MPTRAQIQYRAVAAAIAVLAAGAAAFFLGGHRPPPAAAVTGNPGVTPAAVATRHDATAAPLVTNLPAQRPPGTQEDLSKIYPPAELPMVATAQGARVSLGYLAQNGADLSRPMPSKHKVFAANEQIAAQLAAWAKANGFEVRGPVLVRAHIGTPRACLELVRVEVPVPENIEQEGRLVLAEVRRTPGTYYQTWSGEIVR